MSSPRTVDATGAATAKHAAAWYVLPAADVAAVLQVDPEQGLPAAEAALKVLAATLLREDEGEKTPLQKRLAQFGQRLAVAAVAICGLVFAIGVLRGEPVTLMFLTAISLAVAAIPEALPAVVTVALALGARVMVAKRALIRRLPAVETLGSVTHICSDKTGTLTENRMHVEAIYVAGQLQRAPLRPAECNAAWTHLCRALALSNDARGAGGGAVTGDPTEVALYSAAARLGCDKAREERIAPRLAELPFDSDRKCMTTLHRSADSIVSFTKGAPEVLVERCRSVLMADAETAIDRPRILQQAEDMAAAGLRVLAVAYRRWTELPDALDPETVERDLTLLGLIGLLDPPRPEARDAVALCQSAGITVAMITGDHPATARAIATRLGIIADGDGVITGRELARLAPAQLAQAVEHLRIFARVAPEQKIDIVRALQPRPAPGPYGQDCSALRKRLPIAAAAWRASAMRESAERLMSRHDSPAAADSFLSVAAASRCLACSERSSALASLRSSRMRLRAFASIVCSARRRPARMSAIDASRCATPFWISPYAARTSRGIATPAGRFAERRFFIVLAAMISSSIPFATSRRCTGVRSEAPVPFARAYPGRPDSQLCKGAVVGLRIGAQEKTARGTLPPSTRGWPAACIVRVGGAGHARRRR